MREVNGNTGVLGLLGDPVEHTGSPAIHNFIAERMGDDLIYVPFLVRSKRLEEAVAGAYALNVRGLNVTVPHKVEVMQHVRELDDAALAIGAVNTLVRIRGGFKGYNTDFSGFMRELDSVDIQVNGREVIVLGAGGAAKAVVYALEKLGAKHIYILNRNVDKAKDNFGKMKNVSVHGISSWKEIPRNKYIAIQCTSVGLSPDDDKCVIKEDDFFELIDEAVDLIYKPKETAFMKKVKEHGGKAYNGLRMLMYQAVASYEFFTGNEVSEEILKDLYRELDS
ncbi:MAG: shikimate dehydrogenase [Lachnospiraceae bacterium]|nr:shikimate dehydrogenase [Lachnospiraceae bacterium]